jgi:hypothetical protein
MPLLAVAQPGISLQDSSVSADRPRSLPSMLLMAFGLVPPVAGWETECALEGS